MWSGGGWSILLEVADKVELVLMGTAGGLGFLLEGGKMLSLLAWSWLLLSVVGVSLGFNSAVVETEELVEDREDVDDPPPPLEMASTSYSALLKLIIWGSSTVRAQPLTSFEL